MRLFIDYWFRRRRPDRLTNTVIWVVWSAIIVFALLLILISWITGGR